MCKIIVVEDDALLAFDLETVLASGGYHPRGLAPSVETALALAHDQRPHLALIDVRLQDGGDGIALAEELQRRWGVPSIIVSGLPQPPEVDGLAIKGWISKPFDAHDLLSMVAKHRLPSRHHHASA